jgi:hypothetical protein
MAAEIRCRNQTIILWRQRSLCNIQQPTPYWGRCGCDRMVVGFTTTYAIGANHHWCCEFESRSGRGVQHYVIKFVSDLRQVGGFLRILRFLQNKTDRHNITEILLKVALKTIKQTSQPPTTTFYKINYRLWRQTFVVVVRQAVKQQIIISPFYKPLQSQSMGSRFHEDLSRRRCVPLWIGNTWNSESFLLNCLSDRDDFLPPFGPLENFGECWSRNSSRYGRFQKT